MKMVSESLFQEVFHFWSLVAVVVVFLTVAFVLARFFPVHNTDWRGLEKAVQKLVYTR